MFVISLKGCQKLKSYSVCSFTQHTHSSRTTGCVTKKTPRSSTHHPVAAASSPLRPSSGDRRSATTQFTHDLTAQPQVGGGGSGTTNQHQHSYRLLCILCLVCLLAAALPDLTSRHGSVYYHLRETNLALSLLCLLRPGCSWTSRGCSYHQWDKFWFMLICNQTFIFN